MIFARLGGPQKEIHSTTGHPACRLVVTPDPTGGAAEVMEVPDGTWVEDAWQELLAEWQRANLHGTELDPARRDGSG